MRICAPTNGLLLCGLFWALLCLSACGMNPPIEPASFHEDDRAAPGYAKVYLYRPPLPSRVPLEVSVKFNGEQFVKLKDGSYTVVFLRPGKYVISIRQARLQLGLGDFPEKVNFRDEGTYFLRVEYDYIAVHHQESWRLVSRETALKWLGECDYVKPDIENYSPGT
jgi:hypothetical protein